MLDRLFVCGIGEKQVAPRIFHGDDFASQKSFDGACNRSRIGGDFVLSGIEESQFGAANGAAGRLRVKAAIARIAVFLPARFAHGKIGHGRVHPVEGHAQKQAEARPAGHAMDKGIIVPAVQRIRKFSEALSTDRCIGQQGQSRLGCAHALLNDEFLGIREWRFGNFDGANHGPLGFF